ncbi:MAG: hypothetical protein ABIH18_08705 [Candidatus Omnitrophota bacterium]
MVKYLRIIFMIAALICVNPCYAQEDLAEGQPILSVSGTVSDMNWVTSTLVVRSYHDEITFFVPQNTVITKGAKQIWFSDIHKFSKVTVMFINTSPGPLKAIRISVK